MNKYKKNITKDLKLIFGLLGLQAVIKNVTINNRFINVKISSKEPGRIIGKRGCYLEALTLIINNIFYNRNKQNSSRIVIDIEAENNIKRTPSRTRTKLPSNSLPREKGTTQEEEATTSQESNKKRETNDLILKEEKQSTQQKENKLEKPKMTKAQMKCHNAIKEVKRWGEPSKVANILEEEFEEIKTFFAEEKEIQITYEKIKDSEKGRVLLELVQN